MPVSGAQHCPAVLKAVRFYQRRLSEWRAKMGAPADARRSHRENRCPRYLAHVLQRKAHAARVAYEKWVAYHYDWRSWLPDKWRRIGACETGLNWRHWYSKDGYQGAFGLAPSSWDGFKGAADRRAGPYPADANLGTPRQQYEVALAIWRAFGFSGWGCRGA